MQALFYADGHGVKSGDLKSAMARVQDVLNAMALDTDLLIANMLTAMSAKDGCKDKAACFERTTLLHILSHRADKKASKFLKKELKMLKLDGRKGGWFY